VGKKAHAILTRELGDLGLLFAGVIRGAEDRISFALEIGGVGAGGPSVITTNHGMESARQ
jgi:hypothetical protein